MNKYEKLVDFYKNGIDYEFTPTRNHIFINRSSPVQEYSLLPGHFYTHLEIKPTLSDSVPTYDEYEIMKNPSYRDLNLSLKYNIRKPYYDNLPIYLALSADGLVFNIKILHPKLRKYFIRSYLSLFHNQIGKCYNSTGELLSLHDRISSEIINPFLTVNINTIKALLRPIDFKLGLAITKYNRENMGYLTLIDWNDVPKLAIPDYSTDKMIACRSSFSLFEIR